MTAIHVEIDGPSYREHLAQQRAKERGHDVEDDPKEAPQGPVKAIDAKTGKTKG